MLRTLTVMGTRPEAIKLAPLVKALDAHENFESVLCVTAQHRQMLDQVLELFELHPDVDLDLMRPGQDLYSLTASIITAIKNVLEEVEPDVVFVQGDTTTTLVSALGAFYAGVPIAHIEAGLRTGNLRAPFPEEANRCMTTRLASLHLCPTQINRDNLVKEGIDPANIVITGNTVIDALLWVRDKVTGMAASNWNGCWGDAAGVVAGDAPCMLITGHRRENFGQGMRDICMALQQLAQRHKAWHFIYPVHLNPNVAGPVQAMLAGKPNIHLIGPLDYAPFVFLMNRARIILTDSGGVQEEGPSLGKPVLVMRETTERPEAVISGTVKLVGTATKAIVREVERLMVDDVAYRFMAKATNPYGDGKATPRIIEAIVERLGGQPVLNDSAST
jgi:UDP-N-acetylglucosamine 2-epimerase (non-hydrolysing)